MGNPLFKLWSKKSSSAAPRVTSETLNDKVDELWGELGDLSTEVRNIVDRQHALHEKLDDLENLTLDLGEENSFPVFVHPPHRAD
jgi:hypothetical protein